MFNKRRFQNPTRKEPAAPERRAAETSPRIDLPSFKPGERKAVPAGARTAGPATPGPAPRAGATERAGPTVGRPVAQPIVQPVARPVMAPSRAPGQGAGTPAAASPAVGRVMLVGPDIRLNAEIRACERLVVEGAVEGELSEAERLEIARGGRFRGAAEVETCVVDGLFEGELTVRGVLALKANGRVSGTVRYGEIEIERGGTIAGNVGTHGAPGVAPVGVPVGVPGSMAARRPAGTGAAAGPRPA